MKQSLIILGWNILSMINGKGFLDVVRGGYEGCFQVLLGTKPVPIGTKTPTFSTI